MRISCLSNFPLQLVHLMCFSLSLLAIKTNKQTNKEQNKKNETEHVTVLLYKNRTQE